LWTTRLMGKVSVKKVVLVMNANDAEPSYYRIFGGASLSRFRCYPWEKDFPREGTGKDPYDSWILPTIRFAVRVREFPSPERKIEGTEAYEAYERRQVAFWVSNDPEATSRSRDAAATYASLVRELVSLNMKVLVARYPWRVTVTHPEIEDTNSSKWLEVL